MFRFNFFRKANPKTVKWAYVSLADGRQVHIRFPGCPGAAADVLDKSEQRLFTVRVGSIVRTDNAGDGVVREMDERYVTLVVIKEIGTVQVTLVTWEHIQFAG